jgi:hypothetical protein
LRQRRRGGQGESGQQQRGKAPLARRDGSHNIPDKVRLKLALLTVLLATTHLNKNDSYLQVGQVSACA